MFYIVCVSTERSSVRIGCANPSEAQAKVVELEETGIGKVRVFDDAGKRIDKDELLNLALNTPASSDRPSETTHPLD